MTLSTTGYFGSAIGVYGNAEERLLWFSTWWFLFEKTRCM